MPTAEPTVKRNPIPEGDHILILVSVEEKMQPSFNDPKEETLRWIWQFKAKAVDPETGDRYEFRQYTGPRYGNKKAGLTLLLNQMLPTWTAEQKETINTDKVLQTYYKARIRHEEPDNPKDPPVPRLVFIEPLKVKKTAEAAPVAPAPEPVEEDGEEFDPFADGNE